MKELKAVERIAKRNADNFEILSQVRTKDVLAIAEAFRALEQRAEAAEARAAEAAIKCVAYAAANLENLNRAEAAEAYAASLNDIIDSRESDLRVAEAKLAELEKQEPVAMRYRWAPPHMKMPDGSQFYGEWKLVADAETANPGADYERVTLYARPAPAINLAELVPDEVLRRLEYEAGHLVHHCHHIDEHSCKVDRRDLLTITEACRAAILRHIEQQK